MTPFTHLHLHTDYSLLDGCGRIKDYVKKAKEYGMTSMAITDHGVMFGVIDFYKTCIANGIKPIIGCEFYIAEGDLDIKDETNKKRNHLILLAKDNTGYKNLIKMASIAYVDGFYIKPRIDKKTLEKYHEGIVCLSACIAGEIPRLLLDGRFEEAEKAALWYKNLYGSENYYIEIQNHHIDKELEVLPHLIALARKLDIPLVATNDCHYVNKEDSEAQDVLMCIGMGKLVSDENRLKFSTDELYFRSGDEMAELFKDIPEAIQNTKRIEEQCSLTLSLPGPLPPHFKIEEGTTWDNGYLEKMNFVLKDPNKEEDRNKLGTIGEEWLSEAGILAEMANKGLRERYKEVTKELQQRLDYELNVIISMNFAGYYLIVADYVNWSKNNGVSIGPGRGSGAGSLVAYSIRITDIDPIKYGLLFERFLNPERISMPDFDIDFCTDNRERAIEYVTKKYGSENVGQICTFGTLGVKNCIKDVSRTLDIPLSAANEMSDSIDKAYPGDWKGLIEGFTTKDGAIFPPNQKIKEYIALGGAYAKMADIIPKIEGMVRQIGLHAAGVIISLGGLDSFVPLYRDSKKGIVASQFEMTQIEECGLVKMDFLGLKTLTLIDHTVNFIKRNNPDFDIEKIPENDKKTFDLFAMGNTEGVFQFESAGMRRMLRSSKPQSISDLAALNALYRPGPMDNLPMYIENKNNPTAIDYPFEELKELLKETYGVIVYQEQVMFAARIFAGYSMGAADNLRKIMGKKKKELIPKEKEKFIASSVKNGKTKERAAALFELLEPFAGYGFNKSHAVGYAVIAYQTAYLKANYPIEFMTSMLLMEAQGSDSDKYKEYLNLVKEEGIKIVPPDVNKSYMSFSPEGDNIIYGLEGLKGMGRIAAEKIIDERERNGKFKDFMDFIVRMSETGVVNTAAITTMINAGAFDSFNSNRHELVMNLDKAIDEASHIIKDRLYGQMSLFGGADDEPSLSSFEFTHYEPYTKKEQLEKEKAAIGCYLSGHPLDEYKDEIARIDYHPLLEKDSFPKGVDIPLIVYVDDAVSSISKKGKEYGRISISDYGARADIFAWGKTWRDYQSMIHKGEVCAMIVRKSEKMSDDMITLVRACMVSDLPKKPRHCLNILLKEALADGAHLEEIKNVLTFSHGEYPVMLHLSDGERIQRIRVGSEFRIDGEGESIESLMENDAVESVWWT